MGCLMREWLARTPPTGAVAISIRSHERNGRPGGRAHSWRLSLHVAIKLFDYPDVNQDDATTFVRVRHQLLDTRTKVILSRRTQRQGEEAERLTPTVLHGE